MALPQVLTTVRAFLRAGYPEGAPASGYVPLLALLPRRASVDEVSSAAAELAAPGQRLVDDTSIGVAIRQPSERPCPQDVERVAQRLQALDSPVDDQFGSSG
jgi:hypothetical protein